ncbi:MAG TPA: hypothetical protein VKA48_13145 [Gammaproteobacteria bacterium]|nr:hypothetical protein [Gammaproteobacteria bacterium]
MTENARNNHQCPECDGPTEYDHMAGIALLCDRCARELQQAQEDRDRIIEAANRTE